MPAKKPFIPKLPRAFKVRTPERIMEHFKELTDSQKREFIREHLRKNVFAERIAKRISERHSGAYDLELRFAGVDYQVRERKHLELARNLKPEEREIFDKETLNWFSSCKPEQKLRMLRKRLYDANPLLFIDEVVKTYRETKNPAYIDLLVGLSNTKVLREMAKQGHLELLIDIGFGSNIPEQYYNELYLLGNKGIRIIIKNKEALQNLIMHAGSKPEMISRLKTIANHSTEGLIALINAGFFKDLEDLGFGQRINLAIGSDKYNRLRLKNK